MKQAGTKTIETERLILRRFVADDAEAMYKNWASDQEVTKFLTWPVHASPEATRSLLENWVAEYANDNYYQWAITVKAEGDEPVGSIAIVNMKDTVMKAEVGYCLGKNWWGRGIMTEALGAVINYMFDEVGMHRVQARHDANNPASGAVMKKCGMKYEGTLRSFDKNNQGICDAVFYGILAEDRAEN